MRDPSHNRTGASRFLLLWVVSVWFGLISALAGHAQISSEEHKSHHPDQAEAPVAPGGPPQGEMMGGMDDMMKSMHGTPQKELYPSLMELPELTPEIREEIQQQAGERMRSGAAFWSLGLERLAEATGKEDYAAMQEALAQVREGLEQFESGLAARRALAEGKAPRSVALQWFKQEMNLLPPAEQKTGVRLWGMTPFHTAVMAGSVLFAAAMIAMYFFKMQRATLLLQHLTGAAALPPAAGASPAPPPARAAPTATDPGSAGSARPAVTKWSGKLRVGHIFRETPDVKTYRLMNPLGGMFPFTYLPGQFLTVSVPSEGAWVRRGYTIASSPTQNDYVEITVKHQEEGVVSSFLHTHLQEGDLLECSGPSGSFTFVGRECTCILLIGGGVGITPLMSVLRYLTDRSWPGDIYLLYGCRTPQDIIFREELEYLERRHPNLHVVITISHPEGTDWKGPTGRITKELIGDSVPDLASRYVHICGPVPMMEAVKRMLADLGLPKERIKIEAFGPALGKPVPTAPPAAGPPGLQVALPTVTFSLSDKSAPLPPDKTILDVADEIGVDIDNSCRVGICGICRVQLLSGSVSMAVEDGLEPGDKEQGIVLACQAKSTGNIAVEV